VASFDLVNYSLRPSKSIQRQIVFDGLRRLQNLLRLSRQVYVGLGSIWFTDFIMAHKQLAINDMVSMEHNPVGFMRAVFNQPFKTVVVKNGNSSAILPSLADDTQINERPWVVWLDYDFCFNESVHADVEKLIQRAPHNTTFLVTISARPNKYGKLPQRPDRLRKLFGDVVPDELTKADCEDELFADKVAHFALEKMKSIAASNARPGGFIPAFKISYKDSEPMLTIGGVLPSASNAATVAEETAHPEWRCFPGKPIVAPHLTLRETSLLQAQLPSDTPLTRDTVQKLGFDLADDQIEAFSIYYREYPSFVQIVA
jgi:hypothetical protein